MPLMLAGWVTTTVTLASVRRGFPDEQRGLKNSLLTTCGFIPPDIPAPAVLQPVWSACPLRSLPSKRMFVQLGLDELFPSFERDLTPADE
jgi:hypothetical protein